MLKPDLMQRIKKEYPPADQAFVEQCLSRYGSQAHHREVERVRALILELAQGNREKLEQLVKEAQRDYRDVLAAQQSINPASQYKINYLITVVMVAAVITLIALTGYLNSS